MTHPFHPAGVGIRGRHAREQAEMIAEQVLGREIETGDPNPFRLAVQGLGHTLTRGLVPRARVGPFEQIDPTQLTPEQLATFKSLTPEQREVFARTVLTRRPELMAMDTDTFNRLFVGTPAEAAPGFTLGPGQVRFGAGGQRIAEVPGRPTVGKPFAGVDEQGEPAFFRVDPNDPTRLVRVTGGKPPPRQPLIGEINLAKEEAGKRAETRSGLLQIANMLDLLNTIPEGAVGLRGMVTRGAAGLSTQALGRQFGEVVRGWFAGGKLTAEQQQTLKTGLQLILTTNREILTGERSRLSDNDMRLAMEALSIDWFSTRESTQTALRQLARLRLKHDEFTRDERGEPREFPVSTETERAESLRKLLSYGFSQTEAEDLIVALAWGFDLSANPKPIK